MTCFQYNFNQTKLLLFQNLLGDSVIIGGSIPSLRGVLENSLPDMAWQSNYFDGPF